MVELVNFMHTGEQRETDYSFCCQGLGPIYVDRGFDEALYYVRVFAAAARYGIKVLDIAAAEALNAHWIDEDDPNGYSNTYWESVTSAIVQSIYAPENLG
jgi:hypothetical protein